MLNKDLSILYRTNMQRVKYMTDKKSETPITVRTDLAVEAKDMYVETKPRKEKVPGVSVKDEVHDHVKVSRIIISKEGEAALKKKAGTYVTIYADGVKKQDTELQESASTVLAKELETFIKQHELNLDAKGLIVGLGNWNVTPDALGPMTVDNLLVTNHLFELEYETVEDGYRPVAAISPGVMGVTGMETSDIILSIIDQFKPSFVIVVDALASRSIDRINETIQLTDTGIHPGSGVGNHRKELSEETLGIPVIAIGVPTVVDAVTIANDTLDYVLKHMGREWKEKDRPSQSLLSPGMQIKHDNLNEDDLPNPSEREKFLGLVGNLSTDEKRTLLEEVLTPMNKNFIVTPKEVDDFMNDMAHVIARSINASLHDKVTVSNDASFTR